MENKTNKKTDKGIVKVWLGEDGIIYTYMAGLPGEKEIRKFIEDKIKILKGVTGKVGSFADLNDIKVKIDLSITGKAKRMMMDVAELKKLEQEKVKRMAIFGKRKSVNVIGIIFGMALGVKESKYFNNKEEALKWLKEK